MKQKEVEENIVEYLYKKGAKPNSNISIHAEKIANEMGINLSVVQEWNGLSRYFGFNNGTPPGLVLTKEGVDFAESKNERITNTILVWGTFILAFISSIVGIINFFVD